MSIRALVVFLGAALVAFLWVLGVPATAQAPTLSECVVECPVVPESRPTLR